MRFVGKSLLEAAPFLIVVLASIAARADDNAPPSFSKQIKPFVAKYCMECHNHDDADSGLVVESFESLLKGGEHGPAFVAGKPDESRIVLQLEGKVKPKMPPKAANQPKPEEIALVRAWVTAGAKNDSADAGTSAAKLTLPAIKTRSTVAPKIAAAVFSADGKMLAVAAYKEVVLLNPADGTFFGKLGGFTDVITALALSRDGNLLAVASGAAG